MTTRSATAVAVSGGVDSLYALAAMKERGERVLALHARMLPPELAPPDYETMIDRLYDACDRLHVPLHVADCMEAFAARVIDPFVRAYAKGETPNPCAHCNATVKFGLLQDIAQSLGAARLATGHYIRLEHTENGTALYAGEDAAKDQSYFLSLVPIDRLAFAVSPLAAATKAEVRAFLDARGIATPAPGESQEICFVPHDDYRAFLEKRAAAIGITLPGGGPVLLPDGSPLGTHRGLWHYTEGQRRGLGIAWKEPLYVLGKDAASNTLRVGGAADLGGSMVQTAQVNFLVPLAAWPEEVLIRTRYRQKARPATARFDGATLTFEEKTPSGPYAKGQIATAYTMENGRLRVLGGGVIS